MKLRQLAPQTIHTTGFDKGERTKFKMATSAKTYKIMSSTIYKYKIRAIIREISSNAIDGHMVAGNMNPFDVQLPTVLDPRFIVRDYGTGLSDWMVKEVFATYFESTKTDTDELIGALGLVVNPRSATPKHSLSNPSRTALNVRTRLIWIMVNLSLTKSTKPKQTNLTAFKSPFRLKSKISQNGNVKRRVFMNRLRVSVRALSVFRLM